MKVLYIYMLDLFFERDWSDEIYFFQLPEKLNILKESDKIINYYLSFFWV